MERYIYSSESKANSEFFSKLRGETASINHSKRMALKEKVALQVAPISRFAVLSTHGYHVIS
jgi:hypothetical protein